MNKTTRILTIAIKILAILGFFLAFLTYGGHGYRLRRYEGQTHIPILIGLTLMLPYIVYIISSKSKQKKVLKSNPIDLSKVGLTTIEYFEKKSKKNIFEIYIKNETSDTLIINRNSLLEPYSWYVLTTDKYKPIYFSNGIEFHIDSELNLEIIDFRNQIIGLGDEYFKKHHVPEYVNWAFIIAKPNQGDSIE
ncbi:hypothetical protein [Algibacter mikhailovii]|uniref:hypothetical protein n=1 Tax=Algibacter mikhailovii TaxID=425498 RepID=UPI0024950850|nr:hypothetical protein [Algibacter mikhailovii]